MQEAAQQTPQQKRTAGSILSAVLIALIFVVGAGVLLYPLASDAWNQWRADQLIASYTQQVSQGEAGGTGGAGGAGGSGGTGGANYDETFAAVDAYNATLPGRGVPDAFAIHTEEEDAEYAALLNVNGDGMMGYIKIPKIDVQLPIYHGTGDDVLAKGVGHVRGSALPVGGANTHAVLSAHRGLPSAALFSDLDQLQLGDHFYIYVLDRTLAYEVDQVLTVEPSQTESLNVTEGADLVTLVTCTPYGVNTQRLLVRGHRIDYSPELEQADAAVQAPSILDNYLLWAVVGLAAVALIALLLWRIKRHKEARQART